MRDASAVDDVTRAACAAKQRESDIAFYERKRAEAAKARVEAKSSRSLKSRGAATATTTTRAIFLPGRSTRRRARRRTPKLSGAPFIVQLDFFGLDVFERFRVPFMEKRFYREAFLDVRAKALEADGVERAHAFHLREMAAEARGCAEKAEKARARGGAGGEAANVTRKRAEEAEEADAADDAEDREDVRDGEDKDVVKDVGDDSAKRGQARSYGNRSVGFRRSLEPFETANERSRPLARRGGGGRGGLGSPRSRVPDRARRRPRVRARVVALVRAADWDLKRRDLRARMC